MLPLPLLGRAVPGTALLVLSAAFVIETFAQSGGTPFTGSPQSLPGILQAEDFNNGGEGVAYHDNSPANQGGQYRSSGVDIAAASDVGGGYTLGWVGAGEWLNYTVNVGASGTYQLEVRVASAGTGGTFHIEVDGVDKTGPLPVPNTGGWQSWATIRAPNVVLDAGIQVWRLAMDTYGASGAVGNINYIRVMAATSGETTPFGGVPAALPGVVQAENFDEGGRGVAYVDTTPGNAGGRYRTTDVDIEATADVGGGYNVGWLKPGEWMKYSVTVAAAGTYAVDIRVAAPVGGARFHLDVDGVDRTGALTIPATGAYQAWTTITASGVSLSAGPQVWAIVIDSSNANGGVGNINYIRARAESAGGSSPFGGIALSLPGTIQAENFDEGGRGVAYADTTSGNTGGAYRTTDVDIEATTDAGGGHNVGWLKPGEWMKYTVNVAAAGTYTIEARVAASLGGARFHLESNGVDKTGPLTFPTTGAYQAWTTVSKTGVTLSAGPQVWSIVIDSANAGGGVGNINYIRVSSGTGSTGVMRGPYLQQVTSSTAVVVWTTREPGSGEVRYTTPAGVTLAANATAQTFLSAQTGLATDVYQHEAHLVGLAPATRYVYDVFMGGADVTVGQDAFTSAPMTGSGAVRFIAFGDSGVGSTAQRELAARMTADVFDLAIHGGDVAYGSASGLGGASYPQYEAWVFGVYAPWFRSRPFFPSIGNHDDQIASARAYRDVFVLPENGTSPMYPDHAERFYSFDYGPVHFVALDTELAFQDPARRATQLEWLDADLAATTQPWRVAYMHRPPYSSGTQHGSDLEVRRAFGPLFERHGVQLVISAHEHDYERSIPWREFVSGGSRVVYVVSGGGGAPLHPNGSSAWTAVSASVHHYVRVSISGCTLAGQAVERNGALIDTFSIDRCAATSVAATGSARR